MSERAPAYGLALSGGGFRAAFFHLGVLSALARRDVLRHVRILSCVSGGSIAGAVYYLALVRKLMEGNEIEPGQAPTLAERALTAEEYEQCVATAARVLRRIATANIRATVFRNLLKNATMFLTSRYSRTDRAGDLLDQYLREEFDIDTGYRRGRFARQLEMRSLHAQHPALPHLVLNGTTMNTGHTWRFDTDGMGELLSDWRRQVDRNDLLEWGRYDDLPAQQDMPFALAIAASAAFPGLFRPLPISNLYDRRVDVMDGGAQDNQGIQSLLGPQPPSTEGITLDRIIVSDGAAQMLDEKTKRRSAVDIGRVIEIQGDRIREEQLLAAMAQSTTEKPFVLFDLRHGLGYRTVAPSGTTSGDGAAGRVESRLAELRTDLDAFGGLELALLQRRGSDVVAGVLNSAPLLPIELSGWRRRVLEVGAKQTLKPLRFLGIGSLVGLAGVLVAVVGAAVVLGSYLGDEPLPRMLLLGALVAFLLAPAAISRSLLRVPWSWPRSAKWLGAAAIYAGLVFAATWLGPRVDTWWDASWSEERALVVAASLLAIPPVAPVALWFLLWLQGLCWRGIARAPASETLTGAVGAAASET